MNLDGNINKSDELSEYIKILVILYEKKMYRLIFTMLILKNIIKKYVY